MPITDAEYNKLTPQQRFLLGLDDYTEAAPADFGGAVLPNPNHIRPLADTDSGIAPTRLPNGIKFQHGNFRGPLGRDISNPAPAQLIAPAMQTIAANSQGAPVMGDQVQTVPVFAPDGTLGDIPAEKLHDALAAGYKQGVTMKSPEGKLGVIPADRMPDAAKNGLVPVPLAQQETQHPGFWKSLGSDLAGMVKGAVQAAPDMLPGSITPYLPTSIREKIGMGPAANSPESLLNAGQHYQEQKKAGYSLPYRAITPLAEGIGVNVGGMEQSAQQGDAGGVLGHAAAVPTAMAATAGIAKGAPAVIGAAADALPAAKLARAGEAFQQVSKVAGKHTVTVTPALSDSLMQYQQLVDAGGSRSLAVSKLMNRLTNPDAGPLTYEEARLFQSNISRLSADEMQRLTPVMKRQVGQIAGNLGDAVKSTADNAGQLDKFQGAMKEYAAAKTLQDRLDVLKKYGIKVGAAALLGGAGVAGVKLVRDLQ